jgi:hypothetical protein
MNATANTEKQIAADLDAIELICAIGSRKAKLAATRHRKACFAEIKRMNEADGLASISDEDLLAALA